MIAKFHEWQLGQTRLEGKVDAGVVKLISIDDHLGRLNGRTESLEVDVDDLQKTRDINEGAAKLVRRVALPLALAAAATAITVVVGGWIGGVVL